MTRVKRFYKEVTVGDVEDGFSILLDGRPVRTPHRSHLVLANERIADAVREEWAAQEEEIDPLNMPLTRFANSSIDQVGAAPGKIVDQIVQYAGSDLTCYRAEDPDALQAAQAELWDPLLDWFHRETGARLLPTVGIMPLAQSDEALQAVRTYISRLSVPMLTGLNVATTASGSLVIGTAAGLGQVSVEEAWAAATVDERWQRNRWGDDAEALDRERKLRTDFETAVAFISLHDVFS